MYRARDARLEAEYLLRLLDDRELLCAALELHAGILASQSDLTGMLALLRERAELAT